MKKQLQTLMVALGVVLLIVAAGLGFLFGIDNPVSWLLIGILVVLPFFYRTIAKRNRIEWSDGYSVGIQSIDDDHKKLILLLNQFQTAYEYQTGSEFERQALSELVSYTKYHFSREEGLMKDNGFPGFEAHKAQHDEMIERVEGFVVDYDKRGYEALEDVFNFLKGWLINHINGTDKEYAPFLINRGVV
ncbi:MAG: hemerythrin family protein [Gammaproteobacteria bacterium]|nr:hemerythrin family protein [Gammaproteobacteria bacterium]